MVHIGFVHSRNCIRQYRYSSGMDFHLKAHCDFDFHYFHCAIPKDTVDVEMTIWMMDGIYTYRRDQTTQITSYSPWSRQVKPFSSLRRKIANYEHEGKESHEKRNSNPFNPVRKNKSSMKRSRRSQKSRNYRKLDMEHSAPSTAAPTWPTMTTTTSMANMSVPFGPPTTSSTLSMLKLPAHRLPYKMWAICHPTPAPISSLIHSDWSYPRRRTGMAPNRRRGKGSVKS